VTFPDPHGPNQPPGQGYNQPPPPPPGQGYNQPPPPPPGQGYNQPPPPPPGQGYYQPEQGYQAPPGPGFTPAPPVPVGYGYGQYPADAVPQGMYVDQVSGLMLPDGTQLASVGRRIGAYFLAFPLVIVTLGIGYIIWGLIVWGNGQTPALQVLGMRVWRPETNQVAGFWWMALREIVGRLVDNILGLISGITSFVLMVTGRERKALHDYIAGTVVLHDPNKVLAS
jgi:uncharacterized RDD family membrane protein YckC